MLRRRMKRVGDEYEEVGCLGLAPVVISVQHFLDMNATQIND